MPDKTPSRGFQGAVLKLLRAGEYQLTVTGRRELSAHYLRLSFQAGSLLTDRPLHPTMWIRMWFADGDKLHQRGYTLVDPDPEADTVDIEFAMHDGVASRWAQDARPGDTIEATMLGSNFTLPEPAPKGYVIVGDTASLPAINSLLTAIGDSPAQVPGKLLEGTKWRADFPGYKKPPAPQERDAGGTNNFGCGCATTNASRRDANPHIRARDCSPTPGSSQPNLVLTRRRSRSSRSSTGRGHRWPGRFRPRRVRFPPTPRAWPR